MRAVMLRRTVTIAIIIVASLGVAYGCTPSSDFPWCAGLIFVLASQCYLAGLRHGRILGGTCDYKTLIERYCQARGIDIEAGFGRGGAQRYAVIQLDLARPTLFARTWFNMQDLVYFVRHRVDASRVRVLDFQEGVELIDEGNKRLERGRPIDVT